MEVIAFKTAIQFNTPPGYLFLSIIALLSSVHPPLANSLRYRKGEEKDEESKDKQLLDKTIENLVYELVVKHCSRARRCH